MPHQVFFTMKDRLTFRGWLSSIDISGYTPPGPTPTPTRTKRERWRGRRKVHIPFAFHLWIYQAQSLTCENQDLNCQKNQMVTSISDLRQIQRLSVDLWQLLPVSMRSSSAQILPDFSSICKICWDKKHLAFLFQLTWPLRRQSKWSVPTRDISFRKYKKEIYQMEGWKASYRLHHFATDCFPMPHPACLWFSMDPQIRWNKKEFLFLSQLAIPLHISIEDGRNRISWSGYWWLKLMQRWGPCWKIATKRFSFRDEEIDPFEDAGETAQEW